RRHLYLDGAAGKGLLERDLEIVAQVRAAQPRLPAAPTARPAHEVAENVLENVGHRGREFGPESLRPAPPAAFEGGVAVAIVGCALLGILQRVIRFRDLLELVLGLDIARVPVW